jgi:putative ABC transport system permease protein
MLRATFRSLLERKLRLLLSATSIVLGVAFVAGAFVLTDTLGKTFDNLFSTVNQKVAVDVRGTVTTTGDFGDVRHQLPEDLVATVAGVDGVADAKGNINAGNNGNSGAQVVSKKGKVVTTGGAPTFGFNWVDGDLQPGHLITGTKPQSDDEIVLNKNAADKADYKVGDLVPILTDGPVTSYKLVGILGYDNNRGSLGGETSVWFTEAQAHKALDRASTFDEIVVKADGGVSEATLRDRIKAVLPGDAEAITGKELADEQASDIKDGLQFFNTFLLVFAAIALFVGAFIIFNTFSMLVAQRTRELALMRAIGASRRQVIWAVLIEAVVVGLIASAVGLVAGIGVALGLKALIGVFGGSLPDGPTVVATRTIIVSFVVGVLVTAVAALFPARRASHVSPLAALRDAATPDRPLTRQSIGGAILLVIGVVALGFGLTGSGLKILGIGTLVGFLGIAVLSPLLSRPVAGVIGRLFARRIPGRLGRENSVRNPRRTAVTASALMIGLALVSAVGILGASLKASVDKIITAAVGSDYVLNTTGQGPGFPDDVLDKARGVPGVDQVVGIKVDQAQFLDLRSGGVRPSSSTIQLLALPADALGSAITLKKVDGTVEGLGNDDILVSKAVRDDKHLSIGSPVELTLADGSTATLKVKGVFDTNQLAGDYVIDQSHVSHFSSQRNVAAAINVGSGVDLGTVRAGLDQAIAAYPNVVVQDRAEFVGETSRNIDQIVTFLSVLLLFSVVIAILGVVNTLALSVIERTRELGLLRAVGMSRKQVRRMIRTEAVVICSFGAVLGLVVGSAIGIALQNALKNDGVSELGIPVTRLLIYLLLAALAGVVAAWLPSRRASRLNVLTAIATE